MTVWHTLGLLLLLNLISVCLFRFTKIQLACIQIVLGFIFSSFLDLQNDVWTLLSSFGAAIVAFLAGNEFDHKYLMMHKAKLMQFSLASFCIPFIGVFAILYYCIGWETKKALIASIVLAETSIAMVYSVITTRDYGDVGKFVFCALHLTDLIVLFAITFVVMDFNLENIIYFLLINIIAFATIKIIKDRKNVEEILKIYGPYILIFLIILSAISTKYIKALPVLPVFLLGLYSSDLTRNHVPTKLEIRKFGYLFLIPIYFLRAGYLVSWQALLISFTMICLLFFTKVIAKFVPLFFLARKYGYSIRESGFISGMMSTGLTLGVFIVLFAFDAKIFSQQEYSMLLCVIIITALIPTLIAEKISKPIAKEIA